jgi:hypothetical protein
VAVTLALEKTQPEKARQTKALSTRCWALSGCICKLGEPWLPQSPLLMILAKILHKNICAASPRSNDAAASPASPLHWVSPKRAPRSIALLHAFLMLLPRFLLATQASAEVAVDAAQQAYCFLPAGWTSLYVSIKQFAQALLCTTALYTSSHLLRGSSLDVRWVEQSTTALIVTHMCKLHSSNG